MTRGPRRFTSLAALLILLAWPGRAQAAASVVTMQVTIRRISVFVSPDAVTFGVLPDGAIVQTSEANDVTALNDGNIVEDFLLALSEISPWSPGAAPGADVFVLSGLFVGAADAPTAAHFGADDAITTSLQAATATRFAHAAFGLNGSHVPVSGSRDLWFQYKAPTSSTVFTYQTIVVTVGAVTS